MATKSVGLAMTDDDLARLDELAEHFSGGNRSAYLRATFAVMESIRRADILRDLQARSHQRLAEQGIAEEELDEQIRTSYKQRTR